MPHHTETTAQLSVTPSQAVVGGIIKPGPTSQDAIWYRQPWTVPAAALLCMYGLCSIATLVLLWSTSRLDYKLNVSSDHMGSLA